MAKRRTFTAEYRFKVALQATKGAKNLERTRTRIPIASASNQCVEIMPPEKWRRGVRLT